MDIDNFFVSKQDSKSETLTYTCLDYPNSYIELKAQTKKDLQFSGVSKHNDLPNLTEGKMEDLISCNKNFIVYLKQTGELGLTQRFSNLKENQLVINTTQKINKFRLTASNLILAHCTNGYLYVILAKIDENDQCKAKIIQEFKPQLPNLEVNHYKDDKVVLFNDHQIYTIDIKSCQLEENIQPLVWDLSSINKQRTISKRIVQVRISQDDLIYVMDEKGRIIVINQELKNDEQGTIFIHQKSLGATNFFIPYMKYKIQLEIDSVEQFKRNKRLSPMGLLVSYNSTQLTLWDFNQQLIKKEGLEGTCKLSSNMVFGDNTILKLEGFKSTIILLHQDYQFSIVRIGLNKRMNSYIFSQINYFKFPEGSSRKFIVDFTHFIKQSSVKESKNIDLMTLDSGKSIKNYICKVTKQDLLFSKLNFGKTLPANIKHQILGDWKTQKLLKLLRNTKQVYSQFIFALWNGLSKGYKALDKICENTREMKQRKFINAILEQNSRTEDFFQEIEKQQNKFISFPTQSFKQEEEKQVPPVKENPFNAFSDKDVQKLFQKTNQCRENFTQLGDMISQIQNGLNLQQKKIKEQSKQIDQRIKNTLEISIKSEMLKTGDKYQKNYIQKTQNYYSSLQKQEVDQMFARINSNVQKQKSIERQKSPIAKGKNSQFDEFALELNQLIEQSVEQCFQHLVLTPYNETTKDFLAKTSQIRQGQNKQIDSLIENTKSQLQLE